LLGIVYNELKAHESAIDAYTKGLGYLKKVKDPGLYRYHTLNNVGILYHKSGDYQKAISYFDRALQDTRIQKKNKALYARLLDNRAYSRLKLKDTTGLYDEFNRALKIRDSLGSKLGIITSKRHLAWYRAYAGDTIRATQLANESYRLAMAIQSNSDVLDNLKLLAAIDPVNDTGYLNEHMALKDKLIDHERQARNKFMRIQYETEKYKQQTLELSVKNNRRLIFIGCLLFLLIFLFSYYRQRVRYNQLKLKTTQQKAATEIYLFKKKQIEKLEEGKKEERLRVSELLHDSIVPELYSYRINWSIIDLKGDAESLAKHMEYLEGLKIIENRIRDAAHALSGTDVFFSKNFTRAISELADDRAKIGKFEFTVDADPQIDGMLNEFHIKKAIYYSIEEALHNCILHAKATRVTIKLKIQGS